MLKRFGLSALLVGAAIVTVGPGVAFASSGPSASGSPATASGRSPGVAPLVIGSPKSQTGSGGANDPKVFETANPWGCVVRADNPHFSSHNPGRINAQAWILCNTTPPYSGVEGTLYRQDCLLGVWPCWWTRSRLHPRRRIHRRLALILLSMPTMARVMGHPTTSTSWMRMHGRKTWEERFTQTRPRVRT